MGTWDLALIRSSDRAEQWLRGAAAAGALIMGAGAFGAWMETITIAGAQSQTGIEFFAGKAVLVLAFATGANAIFQIPLELAFVLAGAAGVIEFAWLIGNFEAFSQPPMPDLGITPAIGFGVSLLGTAMAALAGLAQILRRREAAGR
jgi:hypothetical protein